MDKTSFSNSLYSFPKIMSKENSTFYKTFYSNFTPKTTKANTNLKLTPSLKTSLINRNAPLSSYANYTSQLKNNLNNKGRNRKYTSLVKRKGSFSSAETDDTFFALSEIKSMDKKIYKRINKGSVWREKNKNIYDMYASENKKEIEKIRRNIREYDLPSEDFDLKAEINKKKYFPMEKVEIITDATNIMNRMKKEFFNNKKAYETFFKKNQTNLHTFVIQNREICKKNFMIGLIRDERNKIKIKEREIKKDLEDANKIFKKDEAAFDKFTMEKKRQFRKEELNLDLTIRNNKMLMEKIKKGNSDIHETENEIVRNIKGIILYMNYADFIHQLLAREKIKYDLKNIKNILQSKDKDLPSIAKNVIRQFNFLLTKDIPVKTEEINNPDLLTALFFSLEANIIHQMRERDEVVKEKFNEKTKNEEEISELKEKIERDTKKLEIITQELNNSKKIYVTDNYQERMDEASKLIYEFSEQLIEGPIIQNKNKTAIDAVIDATLSKLKNMEDTINGLFAEIETIKKTDKNAEALFKEIYDEIKLKNKRQKQKEGRAALMNLEEEKHLKYLQKNYRYRIRGPIVYPPPWVFERKHVVEDENKGNEINEEEMLYYYDN